MRVRSLLFDENKFKSVGIVCWGRSGTYFIHSLLDHHPQVLSIPPVAAITQFYDRWPEMDAVSSREALADYLVKWLTAALDAKEDREDMGLNLMGPDRQSYLSVDAKSFREHLLELLPDMEAKTRKRVFIALFLAYEKAQGIDVSQKFLIINHLHNGAAYSRFQSALEDFPDFSTIGMMREPLNAFHSHLRFISQGLGISYPALVRRGIYNSYYRRQLYGWLTTEKKYPVRFLTVRLEQLHKDPKGELGKLTISLGIRDDEALQKSTFNNLQWWGDRFSVAPMKGFRGPQINDRKWESYFNANDKIVLYGLIGAKVSSEGYGSISQRDRWLLPLRILWPAQLEIESYRESLQQPSLKKILGALWATGFQHVKRIGFSLGHLCGRDISQL